MQRGLVNKDSLDKLKSFIEFCSVSPEIIHLPELTFFKDYLQSLNATIPAPKPINPEPEKTEKQSEDPGEPVGMDEDSEPESDLELDLEGCIEPDVVSNLNMGDSTKIPTEEDCDKADEKHMEAMSEVSNGNFDKAVELLTEAIVFNPTSAVLFVKRCQTLLQLKKPNACLKDCTNALKLNPDSVAGYKFRGRAYRLLGEWENAAKDLRQACKIDMDEQVDERLKQVTPNALTIEKHRLKQERKKSEKEIQERLERVHKAKEAHDTAAQGVYEEPQGDDPGLGDFFKILEAIIQPEVLAAFKDPEVAAAFEDISINPANSIKYQSNHKVMALVAKLSSKFKNTGFPSGGFPGMGGFPSGGFPGFGGAPGGESAFQDEDIVD